MMFRMNVLPPSSESNIKRNKTTALFDACRLLVSCLAYSLTLEMEAECSSETPADFYQTTRRYVSEDKYSA